MAKQPRPIAGRVVAITGAARGIGRATAGALAREGATVAIGDLDVELARRTAEEIGAGAAAFELDVTDRDSFERFVEDVETQLGPVDVLVNNAGIMPLGPFLAEDDATARRQVEVNVHGVLLGMKIVLPRLVARGRGHVVNIASAAGKAPYPGGATYCGTKHFVVGMSETVRGELRGSGVEMSVVMPVLVDTELATGVRTAWGVPRLAPEDVAEAIVQTLRRPRFDVFVPRSIGRSRSPGGCCRAPCASASTGRSAPTGCSPTSTPALGTPMSSGWRAPSRRSPLARRWSSAKRAADFQPERLLGAIRDEARDRQRRRRRRRGRVAHVQRATGVRDHEVVDERAVPAQRLGANAGGSGQHVLGPKLGHIALGRVDERRAAEGVAELGQAGPPPPPRHPPGARPGQRGREVARADAAEPVGVARA